MADIVRRETDGDHTYRIVHTDHGYLVTARQRDRMGMLFPSEWLHRMEETAQACLDAVIAFNAFWRATSLGYPMEALQKKLDQLTARHKELCEAHDDKPLIGQEVKALRASHEEP